MLLTPSTVFSMDNNLFNPDLVKELVLREDETNRRQQAMEPEPKPVAKSPAPLDPKLALLLGSVADSASTYNFLKNGGREANPALQIFNKKPWTVLPMGVAGALGYHGLYKLVHKVSPGLADNVAGLIGGFHTGLSGENFEKNPTNSYRSVMDDFRPKQK